MRDPQALRRQGVAIGGEARRVEMDADCALGIGGGDDENGSLNLKHENLFLMNAFGSPRPGRVQERADRSGRRGSGSDGHRNSEIEE
jgi:hypothetical protein